MKRQPSIFTILVTGYAILILAWFVSWLTVADANWWLILLNRYIFVFFVPVPLFLAWGVFCRILKPVIPLSHV